MRAETETAPSEARPRPRRFARAAAALCAAAAATAPGLPCAAAAAPPEAPPPTPEQLLAPWDDDGGPQTAPFPPPSEAPAACLWQAHSGQRGVLTCADGSSCNVSEGTWACCASRGGRAQCPADAPDMCASQACGCTQSGECDYCCSNSSCSRAYEGGPRECASSEQCTSRMGLCSRLPCACPEQLRKVQVTSSRGTQCAYCSGQCTSTASLCTALSDCWCKTGTYRRMIASPYGWRCWRCEALPPPAPAPATCRTEYGATCILPFSYKGYKYDGCTTKGWHGALHIATPWCATAVDNGVVRDGAWGVCTSLCPIDHTGEPLPSGWRFTIERKSTSHPPYVPLLVGVPLAVCCVCCCVIGFARGWKSRSESSFSLRGPRRRRELHPVQVADGIPLASMEPVIARPVAEADHSCSAAPLPPEGRRESVLSEVPGRDAADDEPPGGAGSPSRARGAYQTLV